MIQEKQINYSFTAKKEIVKKALDDETFSKMSNWEIIDYFNNNFENLIVSNKDNSMKIKNASLGGISK